MSGGGSGGGTTVVNPSTTTSVQDIPAWEQGYVTDLLGQAQTEAAQPYQQFPGQQVAGFTPDQSQAFSNIEGATATNQANQANALGQAGLGANTANSIYGAGAGDVNAASTYNPLAAVSPYLGAANGYNAAAAAQPYLNQSQGYNAAAAGVATPQGIQSYMSPYTNDVISGIQNEANLNWNQNIMPGVNNEFVGSGQYGSGRNAQVLGQAAGNFQTGLSSNIANALQSGYTTAGNQAATEAGILGNAANTAISGANTAGGEQTAQIGNLLNQGNAASSATNQQAANLVNQGTALGNLESTQAGQQLNAGTTLGNLGTQAANTNLTQNQALQATGQEQQQLNQANLNTAMQNWTNQTQYPEQQSQFLNQIIRGLPTPTATTSASQTPAYSVSPLSGIGGAGIGTLALSGSNGQSVGTATGAKTGGLIKRYAVGGQVDDGTDDEDMTPLDYSVMASATPDKGDTNSVVNPLDMSPATSGQPLASDQSAASVDPSQDYSATINTGRQPQSSSSPPINPLRMDDSKSPMPNGVSPAQTQQLQLLALARGMLTPQMNGDPMAALGAGFGNVADVTLKQNQMQAQQNALNWQRQQEQQKIGLQQEQIEQGRYTPVKDFYGNVTGMVEGKTGKFTPINTAQNGSSPAISSSDEPSSDPQKAAAQILAEQGTVPTQVGNKFDIAGRNKQVDAYNNASMAAKSTIQQLNALDAQSGKYTPGKGANLAYSGEAALGIDPTGGASARAEADKASKALANSFMQANAGAKGSGIRMVQFDAGAVPNPDMPDQARADLIEKNKAIANSQIQRGIISNMYPRMQMSNVNAIMDNYETKNPPVLPTGNANPNWMSYADWLKAGRPDTTTLNKGGSGSSSASPKAVAPQQSDKLAAMKARLAQLQAGQQ